MLRFAAVLATVLALAALSQISVPQRAHADVDLTGNWTFHYRLNLEPYPETTEYVTITQVGTSLTIGGFEGYINLTTREFQVTQYGGTATWQISGTAAPDGNSLTASWVKGFAGGGLQAAVTGQRKLPTTDTPTPTATPTPTQTPQAVGGVAFDISVSGHSSAAAPATAILTTAFASTVCVFGGLALFAHRRRIR